MEWGRHLGDGVPQWPPAVLVSPTPSLSLKDSHGPLLTKKSGLSGTMDTSTNAAMATPIPLPE